MSSAVNVIVLLTALYAIKHWRDPRGKWGEWWEAEGLPIFFLLVVVLWILATVAAPHNTISPDDWIDGQP